MDANSCFSEVYDWLSAFDINYGFRVDLFIRSALLAYLFK